MSENKEQENLETNEAKKLRQDLSRAGRINRRSAESLTSETSGSKTWWANTTRRNFIIGGAATVGVATLGGGLWLAMRDDTSEVDKDSLELQQSSGWNVGAEEKQLEFPQAQTLDSTGQANWNSYLDQSKLLAAYQPHSSAWTPFFVPTLIQSLQFETLRGQLKPIFTADMKESYERGKAFAAEILSNAENAGEVALIVDLPGRDAVAFGAGLGANAAPVVTFDNYPHPLGVVPSHETLAAMLYYANETEARATNIAQNAAPAFILDSNRLKDYRDAETEFDNRYLARLPSVEKLQERGVKSVIYVTPDRTRTQELDDLNEDFVAYGNKGLNVAMLPLSDFSRGQGTGAGDNFGNASNTNNGGYYYGGSPGFFFFYSYPFMRPSGAYASRYPALNSTSARPVPPISAPRYAPVTRPTMFAGSRTGTAASGVGRAKPSGFGRSTVRVSPSGSVVGTRTGRSGYYSPGRSGSFGRGGGYSG